MTLETPIYSRLVAERGDIPARVRDEADRLHRLLEPHFSGTAIPDRPQSAGQQGSYFGSAPLSPRSLPSPDGRGTAPNWQTAAP
ncbi:hypothetical protein P1P70_02395 [Streptomyces sp. MB09-02B]|nr:hypothetical protein [Streptomyces sp. MB09-02B]MDX3638317.1 hypothetical protein [Streptomyces sp. MB09-02B]